jgi:hypothetical protein
MTKKEAVKLARKARAYGYFDRGLAGIELACPVCRERQKTHREYRRFPARKSQPANVDPVTGARTIYRQETTTEALDRMMIDHLTEWCGIDQAVR